MGFRQQSCYANSSIWEFFLRNLESKTSVDISKEEFQKKILSKDYYKKILGESQQELLDEYRKKSLMNAF